MVAPADASLAILTAAFAPISNRVLAAGAGVFGVPLAAPVAASILGRFRVKWLAPESTSGAKSRRGSGRPFYLTA